MIFFYLRNTFFLGEPNFANDGGFIHMFWNHFQPEKLGVQMIHLTPIWRLANRRICFSPNWVGWNSTTKNLLICYESIPQGAEPENKPTEVLQSPYLKLGLLADGGRPTRWEETTCFFFQMVFFNDARPLLSIAFVKFLEKLGGIWTWLPIKINTMFFFVIFYWHFYIVFFLLVKTGKKTFEKHCFFFKPPVSCGNQSREHPPRICWEFLGSSEIILPKWSHSLKRSVQILETFQGISAMPCGCPNKCDPSAYKVGLKVWVWGKNPQDDPIFLKVIFITN